MTFRTPNRVHILLILVVGMFALVGCQGITDGHFLKHTADESVEQPDVVYYVMETDISDEKSGSSDQATDCHLLPFDKQPTKDPHGKHHYYAREITQSTWVNCSMYESIDEPPLIVNSIPDELMEDFGFEKMELRIEK